MTINPKLSDYSLERHLGEYADWPVRSRVLFQGALTNARIAGYQILHQFETPLGPLLISDYACPYEEATSFSLLDSHSHQLVCARTLSAPYGSFYLDEIHWLDPLRARLRFSPDLDYLLRLMPSGGLFRRRPKLQLRAITEPASR